MCVYVTLPSSSISGMLALGELAQKMVLLLLAIMALIGSIIKGSYCTLKLLFPSVMVLPQV
jgi:hypothetical protein